MSADTELIGKSVSLPGGYDNLLVTRKIAEGGFSVVYLAKANFSKSFSSKSHRSGPSSAETSPQNYALKRMFVNSDSDLQACNKEISILRELFGKPHIICYYSHVVKQLTPDITEVKLLMEYAGGGALIDTMNSRLRSGMNGFESEFIEKVLKDICVAVSYLHHKSPKPIVHRDLKIENILIGNSGFMICDFGSATDVVVNLETLNTNEIMLYEEEINKVTTPLYKAPEMIDLYKGYGRIDTAVDIWALGCLCYNLCFFTLPFDSNLSIQNGVYTVPDDASYRINENVLKFISYALDSNYETRPDIFQLSTLLSWAPVGVGANYVAAHSSQTMSENIYINHNESVQCCPMQ